MKLISRINKFSLTLVLLVFGLTGNSLLSKNKKSNSKVTPAVAKPVNSQVQAEPDNNLPDHNLTVSSAKNSTDSTVATTGITNTNNNSADTVLLTMAGKPVLTVKEFDDLLSEVASSDPQVGFILQYDPIRVKESLFENKVRLVIMSEWAQTTGVRNTEKYKADEQKMLEQVHMMLDGQAFIQDHKVEISDADIQEYYDKNKNTDRRLLLAPAGIEAKAVLFEKDQQAQADKFADKLKNNSKNTKDTIENLAKSSDLDVSNLGIINDESANVIPEIKDAILAIQKFPHVAVVKCEEGYWVILASGKVAAKYRPLDQVKDSLRELLLPEKIKQMFDAEMPKLAQKFKIVENKQYFEELKKKQAAKQEQQEELIDLADANDLGDLDETDTLDVSSDNSDLLEDIELDMHQ